MTLAETLTKIKELAESHDTRPLILSLTAALERAIEQRNNFIECYPGFRDETTVIETRDQELTEILGKIIK